MTFVAFTPSISIYLFTFISNCVDLLLNDQNVISSVYLTSIYTFSKVMSVLFTILMGFRRSMKLLKLIERKGGLKDIFGTTSELN